MISIVTPTYNSEKYLETCILSIKNQKFLDYEHIIVDGGSSDKTLEIIKKYEGTYPMRWISEKDEGMYDAISKGFNMAKGDIFCWLNSDDIYMPWTLDTINCIFCQTEINWCTGLPAQIDVNNRLYFSNTSFVTFPRYCIRKGWMDGQRLGCIQQESSFWRRDLYELVGGVDNSYKLAGDYALWRKFAQKEKLYSINSVLAGFRVHDGQKSSDRSAYCNEAHRITRIETVLHKLKIYKIVNGLLKLTEHYIDLSAIINI